jgi:hypothetical protein
LDSHLRHLVNLLFKKNLYVQTILPLAITRLYTVLSRLNF